MYVCLQRNLIIVFFFSMQHEEALQDIKNYQPEIFVKIGMIKYLIAKCNTNKGTMQRTDFALEQRLSYPLIEMLDKIAASVQNKALPKPLHFYFEETLIYIKRFEQNAGIFPTWLNVHSLLAASMLTLNRKLKFNTNEYLNIPGLDAKRMFNFNLF